MSIVKLHEKKEVAVPLWLGILIVLGIFGFVLIAGMLIGSRFFWNRFEPHRRVDVETSQYLAQVKRDPKDVTGWMGLVSAYIRAQEFDKAEEALNQAVRLDKNNKGIDYLRGLIAYGRKDYVKAEKSFKEVIKTNPLNPLGYFELARTYDAMGRYDDALKNLDHIINKIDKNFADVYEFKGQIYEKKKDTKKAVESYKNAVRLDPSRQAARNALRRLGISEAEINKIIESVKNMH